MELQSLARAHTSSAINRLAGIVNSGESEAAQVAACAQLLDRGWGKPKTDNTHELKGEIHVILRRMLDDEVEGDSLVEGDSVDDPQKD